VFPVLALGAAVLALIAPAPFAAGGPWLGWLLGAVMFGMGATLHPQALGRALDAPGRLAVGLLAQYGVMPLAAVGVAALFGLGPELAAGLVLLGACPGGTASNVVTYLARGDVALSVALTTLSTLASVFATPLVVALYLGADIDVPAGAMMASIARIVVAPVLAGCLFHAFRPEAARRAARSLGWLAMFVIAYIIGVVVALNPEVRTLGPAVIGAVALHNAAGLGLGYSVGALLGYDAPVRRTLAIEVGMQNSGLASALAVAFFGPVAALPGAVFSVWHNLSGSLLAAWWGRAQDRA